MTHESVKIVPRASNAFNIEVNKGFSEDLAYVLEVHTDQDRVSITATDGKGELIEIQAVIGFYDVKGNQKINANHLTFQLIKNPSVGEK